MLVNELARHPLASGDPHARSGRGVRRERGERVEKVGSRPGGTTRPCTPSSTSSGIPLTPNVTTGSCVAIASMSTTGMPSAKLDRAKTSASS